MAAHLGIICPLLGLPPELRNIIYHLALVQPDEVLVTPTGYERLGLLSSCRIIRTEALKIYCRGNAFMCQVFQYDITPIRKLLAPLRAANIPRRAVTYGLVVVGHPLPHWSNLLKWLECYHCRDVMLGLRLTADWAPGHDEKLKLVLSMLFQQVEELRDLNWSRVSRVIEAQRLALVAIDQRWA